MCIPQEKRLSEPATSGSYPSAPVSLPYIIAHEIRSPLAYIAAAGELLASENLSSEQVARVGATLGQRSRRLNELVNELLELVSDTPQLNVEAGIELYELVTEFVRYASHEHPECEFVLHDADAIECVGSPALVGAVLRNLLDNAARVSAGGQVTVSLGRQAERVSITVEDSGPGLTPAALATLRGESVPPNPGARPRMHGLGLHISRHLSHLAGCTLEAPSGQDHGVVRLWLTCRRALA